jgi:hypothetical protein
MDARTSSLIEHLILQGGIEISDIDLSTGETYYKVNDKLQEIAPTMYKELEDQFSHHLFVLGQIGPKAMTWRIRG